MSDNTEKNEAQIIATKILKELEALPDFGDYPAMDAVHGDVIGILKGIEDGRLIEGVPRICDQLTRLMQDYPDMEHPNFPAPRELANAIEYAAQYGLSIEGFDLTGKQGRHVRQVGK